MKKIIEYLKEVKFESKNIKWPTKKTTTFFTVSVLAIAVVFAAYIGLLDFIFTEVLNILLSKIN